MVQFFSCLKFDSCCFFASHVQFASCGDKELCLRTVGFMGFTWCVGFVQATRVVHSKVILWFSLSTLRSSGRSMPPTKQIQRMAATCIRFDSKMWSALWHRAMQNLMLALRDATAWCHRHSTSPLLAPWIGQSSALWWGWTTGLP